MVVVLFDNPDTYAYRYVVSLFNEDWPRTEDRSDYLHLSRFDPMYQIATQRFFNKTEYADALAAFYAAEAELLR